MEFSKVKDILKKDGPSNAFEFLKKNARYFSAAALFAVLVLVLVNCADPKQGGAGANIAGTETEAVTPEAYQIDANQDINNLISQYYAAYAAGDLGAVSVFATPISSNEQSYITLFSQYVDEYRNIKCYTKSGLDENSYLVSVYVEIKFAGVDTVAPGLDFFYVRTNEDGSLYIDNLYSQYNLANQENALDTSVQNLINDFENQEDVIALQQEVQTKYNEAVAADENLSTMITATIPNAITEWVSTLVAQSTETPAETPSETPAETPSETPEEPPVETPAETPAEEPQATTETLYATDRVNVRAAADTTSERLGSVEMGAAVTRTGTDGEWSIIDYNGTPGYVKSEFLTADASSIGQSEGNADTSGGSLTEGTVIMLENTTNIRSSMSETADKVGTAYAGEKVTVVMSYAEGWTKVSWNGKTGYVKTSLLQ